jgi:hypothetical protein
MHSVFSTSVIGTNPQKTDGNKPARPEHVMCMHSPFMHPGSRPAQLQPVHYICRMACACPHTQAGQHWGPVVLEFL